MYPVTMRHIASYYVSQLFDRDPSRYPILIYRWKKWSDTMTFHARVQRQMAGEGEECPAKYRWARR